MKKKTECESCCLPNTDSLGWLTPPGVTSEAVGTAHRNTMFPSQSFRCLAEFSTNLLSLSMWAEFQGHETPGRRRLAAQAWDCSSFSLPTLCSSALMFLADLHVFLLYLSALDLPSPQHGMREESRKQDPQTEGRGIPGVGARPPSPVSSLPPQLCSCLGWVPVPP